MKKKTTMYAVPEAIASELHLTRIRSSNGSNMYLLSVSDLRPYGVARALAEGAVALTEREAKTNFTIHE